MVRVFYNGERRKQNNTILINQNVNISDCCCIFKMEKSKRVRAKCGSQEIVYLSVGLLANSMSKYVQGLW